jgi:hypothetical protein
MEQCEQCQNRPAQHYLEIRTAGFLTQPFDRVELCQDCLAAVISQTGIRLALPPAKI